MKLSQLKEGETVKVISLNGGCNFIVRVKNMGITEKSIIKVLKNDGRGPLIVENNGTKIILGRMMAEKIGVEKNV